MSQPDKADRPNSSNKSKKLTNAKINVGGHTFYSTFVAMGKKSFNPVSKPHPSQAHRFDPKTGKPITVRYRVGEMAPRVSADGRSIEYLAVERPQPPETSVPVVALGYLHDDTQAWSPAAPRSVGSDREPVAAGVVHGIARVVAVLLWLAVFMLGGFILLSHLGGK